MKHTLRIVSVLCFLFQQTHSQSFNNSQLVTKIWTHLTGNPGDTLNWTNQILDASGNLIIIGNSLQNNQTTDMLLTKYKDSDGSVLWQVQYDNNGYDDFGISVVCDAAKNIYAATTSYVNSTNGYDWVIQKYDSNGTTLWTKTFNSGIYDVPTDMKYDVSGNLYVTGVRTASTTLQDYCTIKFNTTTGNQVWASPAYYDYANLIDIPAAVTIGASGRIIVAGGSGSSLTNWDFATVRYNPATGAQVNVTRNASNGLGFDQVTAVAKDQYDNIYLTGYVAIVGNGYDIKIVKLDTALNTVWSVTKDGGGHLDDAGNAMGVDASGYVYVTGYTKKTNGGTDFITLKYNSGGTLQWSQNFTAPDPTKSAIAKKLDIDPYGNVLILGDAYNIGNRDLLALAYDVNGNLKWQEWYNGTGNGNDYASAIKIDDASNYFYVTGKVWTGTSYQYATTKYLLIDYITPPDTDYCPKAFAYYENKGQIIDNTEAVRNDLSYFCQADFPTLYFSNSKVNFQFYKHGNDSTIADSSFRFEMQFQSGLSSKIYSAGTAVPGYLNYFKPQCLTGATQIKGKQYLLMKGIYKSTDVLYYGNSSGMKMYFNCYPGSNPSGIVLNFVGATSVNIVSTHLKINTPLGSEKFNAPQAFQIDATGNKVSVGFTPSYASAGSNKISFTLGAYNASLPLIIEVEKGSGLRGGDDCPNNCEWSTFYEGTTDVNKNVKTDGLGNTYVIGVAFNGDFVTTAGVIQQSTKGFADALVEKFDKEGHRKWATYFGGNKNDYGQNIGVDGNRNVFFTGYTQSDTFPTLSSGNINCYVQQTKGCPGISSCYSAFIGKLDSNAILNLWSTYFGGDSATVTYGLKVDAYNNVFICGSGTHVPVGDSIGYFSSIGSGFIQKFTNDGVPVWGTTIGTNNSIRKIPHAIDVGGLGIYLSGEIDGGGDLPSATNSYSGSFPIADAFIIDFNAATYNVTWSRYLGGTNSDFSNCLVYVKDYVYVGGNTFSNAISFPVTNLPGNLDYFDSTFGGGFGYDIFLARLAEFTGAMDWCTYYGGSAFDEINDMCLGHDGNNQPCFYITGYSNSHNFPVPPTNLANAYVVDSNYGQLTPFFSMFNSNLSVIWSTFFGGSSGYGAGSGIAAYSNKKLYLAGNYSTSSLFPFDDGTSVLFTPPDPYFWDSTQGNNGFLARFDIGSVLTGTSEVPNLRQNCLIYPNPTDGNVSIALNSINEDFTTITITNDLGTTVVRWQGNLGSNSPIKLDLSPQASGIYFVSVKTKDNVSTTKLIVQ